LDRPPEQERDLRVAGVLGTLEQTRDDRQGARAGEALGRTCELVPHRDARVAAGELLEPRLDPRRDLAVVTREPDGPGADVLVAVPEELERAVVAQPAADVQRPERLEGELAVGLPADPLD